MKIIVLRPFKEIRIPTLISTTISVISSLEIKEISTHRSKIRDKISNAGYLCLISLFLNAIAAIPPTASSQNLKKSDKIFHNLYNKVKNIILMIMLQI